MIFLSIVQAIKVYTEQLLESHRGQGMEIYWRDNFICPSEDEYRTMTVRSKVYRYTYAQIFMRVFFNSIYHFQKLEVCSCSLLD